jgi:hypothetical protein
MAAQPPILAPLNNTHIPVPAPAPVHDVLYPPQLGTPAAATVEDAPPSYEDAMADEISPADGPRMYSGVTDVNAPSMDEKGPSPRYSVTTVGSEGARSSRGR